MEENEEQWEVRAGGGHVREVEDEVRADVEGLKNECPEWKPPRVRVVKHPGVLMEEVVDQLFRDPRSASEDTQRTKTEPSVKST